MLLLCERIAFSNVIAGTFHGLEDGVGDDIAPITILAALKQFRSVGLGLLWVRSSRRDSGAADMTGATLPLVRRSQTTPFRLVA
jgi:hypothetical protein